MKYSFQNPADKFRGLDLWMVNDKLEDSEIENQVKEFKAKGFYSVIFRTYNGLISDYPGPEYKHKVKVAVDSAKKYGLKLALQAGFMPSAYPALPKEYALHKIVPINKNEIKGNEIILSEYNNIVFTDQISPATLNMLDDSSVDYYINNAYQEMWKEFSEEFGKTIIAVWLDEPRFDNRYLTWNNSFEQKFKNKYGYSILKNIPLLYFNIGDYKKVRYHYFTFMRDAMEKVYFSKVRKWCHKNNLFFAGHLMGEDFFTTQIAQSTASMPFYKYFDVPGVDNLCCYHDWYDKPLTRDNHFDRKFIQRSKHIVPLQCVSVAEQAGKELKLCEMYGVTSPGFNFRDQKHLFDYFASVGINHQCMHALFYSPRGFRKRFYPQSFNVYEPFWEDFKCVKDYVASVSSFVSIGKTGTDIALLHPLETAYGLFQGLVNPNDVTNRLIVENYDKAYYNLIVQLYGSQIPFHFADQSTIDSLGKIEENKLKIGKIPYKVLVIADIEVLSTKTYNLIKEFISNGGVVFIKGQIPCRLDGKYNEKVLETFSSNNVKIFNNNEELVYTLKQIRSEKWDYISNGDCAKTVINHRTYKNQNLFFIHNGDCRKSKNGTLILNGTHNAFTFNAETGKIEKIFSFIKENKTHITFTNPVGGSTMIFTKKVEDKKSESKKLETTLSIPLNISCKPLGQNLLTLEQCYYKTEKMADFSENPIIIEMLTEKLTKELYQGNITMRFVFYSNCELENVNLVIEDFKDCIVSFNDKVITAEKNGYYFSTAFEKIALPNQIKQGENIIEVIKYYKPQVSLHPSDNMTHLFELFRSPSGTDIERIHLLGDFIVKCAPEYSMSSGLVRVGKIFTLEKHKPISEACDLTSNGYPFYPDAVEYNTTFNVNKNILSAKKILLKIGEFTGCSAKVYINDKELGYIDKDPYTLEIDKKLLKEGCENKLKIRLLGTFRNTFGPSHFLDYDYSGSSKWTWLLGIENCDITNFDTENLTYSFQLAPYGIQNVSLEIIK